MRIIEKDGGSFFNLDTNTSATTSSNTWYEVRIVADGADVTVYRGVRGEQMEEVLSTSSAGTSLASARVKFANGSGSEYEYDNIEILADDLSGTPTYAYNNGNELTSMSDVNGTTSFTYDDWGRQVSKYRGSQSADYTYADGSKLAEVSSSFHDEGDVDYAYRGDGKRHKRTQGSDVTVYTWAAGWVALSEESGSGTLQRTYVPEQPAAETSLALAHVDGTSPSTGDYAYYLHDHLGSTRFLYDQSMNLDGALEYTPYGGAFLTSAPSDLTRRFTGHTWDAASALYYAPYRIYSPRQSRWLTRDPLGMVDGPNVYAYVRGNPCISVDLLGMACGPEGAETPIQVGEADLTCCCQNHDNCYEGCGDWVPFSKQSCDIMFLSCMLNVCDRDESGLTALTCFAIALTLFEIVADGGWGRYNYRNRKGRPCSEGDDGPPGSCSSVPGAPGCQ